MYHAKLLNVFDPVLKDIFKEEKSTLSSRQRNNVVLFSHSSRLMAIKLT